MTAEQRKESIAIMELKLVSEILECNQAVLPGKRFIRHRHLFEDGVAGLNYMPLDAKNDDVVCFSNSTVGGVCATYFGRMELYLQEDADEQFAINNTLYSIRNTMQKSDFPAVGGIVQVWYLEPELNDISEISDGSDLIVDTKPGINSGIDESVIDGSFSTGTMIAFAALGGFVFAALIIGVFRMRRNEHDGISTLEPGSCMTGSAMTTANDSYGSKQPTPVSAIFPNSYKLDESDAMSCIPEGDSDSDSRHDCSVIVSDGGYTSDGDSQKDDSLYSPRVDPVLGAFNIDEGNMDTDRDLLFENVENFDEISSMGKSDAYNKNIDSEHDLSNHRKKNLVTGSDVSLGQRHSGNDVHQCNSAWCTICEYKPKDVDFIHNSPDSPDVSTGKFFDDVEGGDEEEL